MALNRDAILERDDIRREKVPVPEWGGDVFLREMTGTERDRFEADSFIRDGAKVSYNYENQRARLLLLCLCDDAGNRLLGDSDLEALGRKSAIVLDKLFVKAQQLNGMAPADVENAVKNLEPGPSGSFISD